MFYFPMAGLSSRFAKAGYDKPKYYLDVGAGLNLFQASLQGFSNYFGQDDFCFIYLDSYVDGDTIREWAAAIGLPPAQCHTIGLPKPTKGQADTIRHGILDTVGPGSEEVVIFNIDTVYHDFRKPAVQPNDPRLNYLDVTEMPGDHWSFVDPDDTQPGLARRVVEKQRISALCSVGLYGFESAALFLDLHAQHYTTGHAETEEYVAPMYQALIDAGASVHYRTMPRTQFDFLGTPQEYQDYLASRA